MNRALVLKAVRDSRATVAAALAAVVLFEALFVLAMQNVAPELIGFVRRFLFLQRLFRVLVGLDLAAGASPTTLVVLGLLHPFLSAVTWGTLVALGTRVPAGEIDRGTAELLLTLPVRRGAVYRSTAVVSAGAAGLLSLAAWAGIALGTALFPLPEPVDLPRLGMAAGNLAALLLAIGGTTALVSSAVNRRGVAVAIVLALLLASFLINFLAVFIPFFERIQFLGLLDYYRPVDVVRDGRWPRRDLAVLLGVGAAGWAAGLLIFRRKDVPV